jgi:hypothetical protein
LNVVLASVLSLTDSRVNATLLAASNSDLRLTITLSPPVGILTPGANTHEAVEAAVAL